MSSYQFETVEVPTGSFISWGPTPGQVVTGKVIDYSPAGGTDFNGNTVPTLTVKLVEAAYSINKAGQRFDHGAGELITITCGLANLKRGVQAAGLNPGDIVRITFASTGSNANGTFKVFEIAVARGAGRAPQQQPAAAPQAYQQPVQQPPVQAYQPAQGMNPPF